jgi:malonyl-CoA/methylmalonyl-CoA synthetase
LSLINCKKVNLPLIERAKTYEKSIAIVANEGTFTYQDLLDTSAQIATLLLDGKEDLQEARVAFLIPSGFHYVTTLWGIWRAGGIATPLCVSHPRPELEYVIADSGASIIIAHPDFADLLGPIAIEKG